MLGLEELPVEFAPLLFQPQTQNSPGDDVDLLHPAMGRPTQHHDIRQHVVSLRAACDVVLFPSRVSAAVQQVAEFAEDDILGVPVQQSLVANRHHFPS
jgi:hypothetical protein